MLCYCCSSGLANTFEALLYCSISINVYWMTEWDKSYQAWDCDLNRIFFFFFYFYFGMILDFQKNYEDTKEYSHILIIQTPLYNILHNCNFYAVLSKLIKLALLLFYSLQTFFEFHHFSTYTVYMSQDQVLDLIIMSPCLFLSGTIFEQAFASLSK